MSEARIEAMEATPSQSDQFSAADAAVQLAAGFATGGITSVGFKVAQLAIEQLGAAHSVGSVKFSVELDVVTDFNDSIESLVAQFPIEGRDRTISDHQFIQVKRIPVRGIISPFEQDSSGVQQSIKGAREKLKSIIDEHLLCSLHIDGEVYNNLVLENVSFPRTPEHQALEVVCNFVEMRFTDDNTLTSGFDQKKIMGTLSPTLFGEENASLIDRVLNLSAIKRLGVVAEKVSEIATFLEPDWETTYTINKKTINLRMTYSIKNNRWFVSTYDASGNPISVNRKVVNDVHSYFDGEAFISCVSTDPNDNGPPTWKDFYNNRCKLLIFEPEVD